MTTVRLFNLMLERTKLEKGYHQLSDIELQAKSAELKKKIDEITAKLGPNEIAFVQNQITAMSDADLQEQE